jgi:hypothetical protein
MIENYILLIFGIIIIVAIIFTFMIEKEGHISLDKGEHLRKKVETFCLIFSALCVIITLLFYYSVINLQKQQQQIFKLTETAKINNSIFRDLLGEISLARTTNKEFVMSLFSLQNFNDTSKNGVNLKKRDIIEEDLLGVDNNEKQSNPLEVKNGDDLDRFILSQRIFSTWEDLIEINDFNNVELNPFVNLFLQFCLSSQLEALWNSSRINYGKTLRTFGDKLFSYSKKIKDGNIEDITNEFINDYEIKKIFH